jgi:hypothetical protein
MPGGSEHDPIAPGGGEACVRRQVIRAEIRLDLDDASDTTAGRVVADQPAAEERGGCVERPAVEDRPVEDAQRNG